MHYVIQHPIRFQPQRKVNVKVISIAWQSLENHTSFMKSIYFTDLMSFLSRFVARSTTE